jgi:putative transcriptional regulator
MTNLKKLRTERGLTQEQLAKAIGQTQGSVCHYESGSRKPDIPTCHQIAVELSRQGEKVTIEDIFPHQVVNANAS